MTKWVRIGNKSSKVDKPCLTIRKSSLAVNSELMRIGCAKVGDFAECFVSDCGGYIAISFHKEDDDARFKLTPDGGGTQRVGNNAVVSTSSFASHPALAHLVGADAAKILVQLGDGGKWVGAIPVTWRFKASERNPQADEIGVYKYTLNGETVYIGHGAIQDRCAEAHRKLWMFDEVYYLVSDKVSAKQEESRLLRAHIAECGALPFYNKALT